jgi:signal transduction histidine kinase
MEEKVKEATEEIRKANEQLMLSQRLSAAGKLAAGVAHEINNPLGGMLNAVNKLKKSVSADKEKEYFELLEECIQRIEKLVKELLAFVRKEEKHSAVELNECIDFAQRMAQHALSGKDISFEKELPADSVVQGNATELQQMFLNLFLNAVDSMEKGKGTLRVAGTVNADKGRFELRVSDTGCGIPASELDEVFDLFYTTKESGKGSGLGLGIVHAIIKHHRGTIEIESEEGVGTTVVIGLPLNESEQA